MNKKPKILFIVPYPTEGASNRVRIEAYIPYFEANNISCRVRPFIPGQFYEIVYKKGFWTKKLFYFIISTINRMIDILRAMSYDIIFIHRESYPFGPAVFELIFKIMRKSIIFDFDDAIYIKNTSGTNAYIDKFKNFEKIKQIIKMSNVVIAGNKYLKEYALHYNDNVHVVPTSVDLMNYEYSDISENKDKEKVVIGWIGSLTTEKFLIPMKGVFKVLNEKYPGMIEYNIIGGRMKNDGLDNINNLGWSLSEEKSMIKNIDIGIMPMPDNEWTKGKCGYKALLYMSMGIPVVASPVGVNNYIISDGVNGFLALREHEWIDKLARLIENPGLRKEIGSKGRDTVKRKYSIETNRKKMLDIVNGILQKGA